jgi:hypothetical protein
LLDSLMIAGPFFAFPHVAGHVPEYARKGLIYLSIQCCVSMLTTG